MALRLKLRSVSGCRSKSDRILRATFRGQSHYTRPAEHSDVFTPLDSVFEWPVARPVENNEVLEVHLHTFSKCFTNKLVGRYGLVLQRVVEDGLVSVTDTLVDANNRPLGILISLEVSYTAPDGSVADPGPRDSLDDDRQALIDIEQNIANLEHCLQRQGSLLVPDSPPRQREPRKRSLPSTMKNLANIMRLGKQRPPPDDEERLSLQASEQLEYGSTQSLNRRLSENFPSHVLVDDISPRTDDLDLPASIPYSINSPVVLKNPKPTPSTPPSALRAQDFQVCITVVEARHLAGLNMDPVVCVQVGDQKKYTSVKESTNCPYYNEYFVFDFHMAPSMLFDKIITLTVLHSRNFIRSGKVIGSFKLDVGTVFCRPDHQFYHKWALLTDPDGITSGPKGYVKCDIAVVGKGDMAKPPPKAEKDEDDIEANLLLPEGVPAERQYARFVVKIYRADGLPRMHAGLVANVKKAITGDTRDLVDPYVQVSFAGLTGKTSVVHASCQPVWNEQVEFTEMFPPLCQRIKIQLRDSDAVNDAVIGTHFVELAKVSNEGEKGFLPTFGPCYLHLYGSTRDYTLYDEHTPLNDGLGEGVMYRGRLLVALRTEILDSLEMPTADVEIQPLSPVKEGSLGRSEEFFLYGCVLEAAMLDKRVMDKPIFFELSLGNAGNTHDSCNSAVGKPGEESGGDSSSSDSEQFYPDSACNSTTPPLKPATNDRFYFHLPYGDDKPSLWVRSVWPDHRRRMHDSNLLARIAEKLDAGLSDVQEMVRLEKPHEDRRLRGVLEEMAAGCGRFLAIAKGNAPGKTKLDKERSKLCQRELDHLATVARTMKPLIAKNNLKEKLRTAQGFLQRLRELTEDPQHALPDVFVWLMGAGGKRLAYHRIPARDLLFSIVEEESGKWCGRVQTIFLKLPGKKGAGPGGWAIQGKLQMYFWLGLTKHKKHYLKGLPKGYRDTPETLHAEKPQVPPPFTVHYVEKQTFQLRAHMYQARSLIGSDSSGLSDPFARVVFSDQSLTTQVIDETLSPTWDELLLFPGVTVYGSKEHIKADPPVVVVEIFDQDKVGKSEFIGRTLGRPHVRLSDEVYARPCLEWHDVYRGVEPAGELLAAFELLQFSEMEEKGDVPALPQPKEAGWRPGMDRGPILPVPKEIRPTLSTYRIEVLFWGLRELRRVHLLTVDRPRADIECGGHVLQSSVILNYRKNPNFAVPVKHFDVELPDQEMYCPPLTIRVIDCRSFGRFTLVGTHNISSLQKFIFRPQTRRDKPAGPQVDEGESSITLDLGPRQAKHDRLEGDSAKKKRRKATVVEEPEEDEEHQDWWSRYFASCEANAKERECHDDRMSDSSSGHGADVTYSETDPLLGRASLSKYGEEISAKDIRKMKHELEKLETQHLISESPEKKRRTLRGTTCAVRIAQRLSPKFNRKTPQNGALIKVYRCELENVPEFGGFKDWLHSFDLYRGKRTGDELEDQNRIAGVFKGSLKVYKVPLPQDMVPQAGIADPQLGFFQSLPNNEPIHVLVRVYIVKATDLHPADLNGKADPYIVITLGTKKTSDKENYISKQLNPIFGKCFEFEATFPQDSLLSVQVFDWDLLGTDDLIGETRLDLENRFYSRHRALCGLPTRYELSGPNQWRDPLKPTQILSRLCREHKLDGPYIRGFKVRIGCKVFTFSFVGGSPEEIDPKLMEEQLALAVLHRWQDMPRVGCRLVPEHVECRPLYHPDKPGIEQGKVEMWVDMFPMDMPLPSVMTDISPRKPKSYELRVIIWNTDDVVLEDDAFFNGEKMSDIYVKGWLKGQEDTQCTDIHYRSLTGEGNFNWRFIYPFDYLPAEEKIVISRKESLFSWDETECKIPARLELQVWDADHFSADDFLGAITLDLNRFPRGAKSAKLCTLAMLKSDGSVPSVSIFKQRRVKGWWPFYIKKENDEMELTGKVEAELQLLSKDEVDKSPAGLGRNEPDPLDKPHRPDSSFIWFLNPLKSIRYIIWQNYKWLILKIFIFAMLALILALFVYSVPGYTVKKMLGA